MLFDDPCLHWKISFSLSFFLSFFLPFFPSWATFSVFPDYKWFFDSCITFVALCHHFKKKATMAMGDEPRVRISSTAVTIIAWNAVAMATMDLIPFQIPEILFRFQIGVEKRKQENNHQMKTSSLEFCTTLWKWTVSEQILWASPADFQGAKRKRKRERERERERERKRQTIDW